MSMFNRRFSTWGCAAVILTMFTGCEKMPSQSSGTSSQSSNPGPQSKNDEERVLELDEQWAEAEDTHDEVALRRILDDGFLATAGGKVFDKEPYIRAVLEESTAQTIVHDAVRLHGDTAVVVDTVTVRSRVNGKDTTDAHKCTVAFIKRQGDWRAIAGQCGPLSPGK